MMIANHYTNPQQPYDGHQRLRQHLDVDNTDSDSIASSPHSTQSSLCSQYSNGFQNTLHSTTSDTVPRRTKNHNNFKFPSTTPQSSEVGTSQNLKQVPDLMPSDSQWLLHHMQTPRTAQRLGHHRESSLSSLGSNGPASPYNANTSNPHIAVTDSNNDVFHDMSGGDSNYSYQTGKSMLPDNFHATLQGMNGHGVSDMSFADGLPSMPAAQNHQSKPRVDRGLLPAPELTNGSTRSHPVSVASSITGGDSPATPSFQEPEDDGSRRRKNVHNAAPKLDRTMTDIYSDELYSPNFTITSASPPPQTHLAMSPSNDVFAQRLQAANSQYLMSAVHSPKSSSSRNQSPFRHGSPLAPSLNDFSQQSTQVRLSSAQQLREKRKAEQDTKAVSQHISRKANQHQGTPSTISPKDAMLEFNEPADGSNFPLFPSQESISFDLNQLNKTMPQQSQAFPAPTPLSSHFNFDMPANLPHTYPFVAQPRQQQQSTPSVSTFSRVGSVETIDSNGSDMSIRRPIRTNADGGTYTCTYHGCRLRFETPALLQKHKREGHRQANALSSARATVTSPVESEILLNTQTGPHRCDRINPSTGKSCNTVFSRPYDLTRHEDTIHNARKQKVRCNLCTEEKTFSRADALTRHYRVCHPDVDFPGKHRRRGGSAA